MSEERRRIEVGVLPRASEIFVDGVDPLTIMLRDANARLDAERAEADRARLIAVAGAARMANTKRARMARRFRKILKVLAR
jgi:hypothetical protein